MAVCPALLTGDRFAARVLAHIDCQAAYLGSYGWSALGEPGSLASQVMTGLLTLFVALFAVRLMFGPLPGARDLVGDVLKIGIALTLAFSWPAFRTLIYDVVIAGPGELAAAVAGPSGPGAEGLAGQLQRADENILTFTAQGAGRQSGAYLDEDAAGGTFRAQALADEEALGMARLFFLGGVLASFGLLRIFGGFLLALAPLAAGLLLFESTRGIFSGWLRGLVLTVIGTAAVSIVVAGELAILLPWLDDVLRLRALGYATPSAPTELWAMTAAFALVKLGAIWLSAKVAFTRGWLTLPASLERAVPAARERVPAFRTEPAFLTASRSQRIADHMETQLRRETGYGLDAGTGAASKGGRGAGTRLDIRPRGGEVPEETHGPARMAGPERLGSAWRRPYRQSRAGSRRDTA